MSIKLCCCLCFTQSYEYISLQNELGESNKAYEITVTYFDPMLLTGEEHSQLVNEIKVLCQTCWCHIEYFHEFHQAVKTSRSEWEKKWLSIFEVNRIEELDALREEDKQNYEDSEEEIQLDTNFKDEMEDCEDDLLFTSEDEDEKPLIELIKSKAVNNIEVNVSYRKKCKIKTNIKQKTSKGGKAKAYIKQDTVTEINSGVNENSTQITNDISPDITKKIARITNCREKCKESDNYISKWKDQLECDLCQASYPNFETLKNHFGEKHIKTKCYMKCCERKFYHRYVLVEHIRNHINPEIHKCDICDKVFSNKNNVKLHKRVVHETTKKLECNVCHKFFKQKFTLNRHLLTHVTGNKDFICPECGKGYVAELLLKLHIKHVHNVDRVCDQCGKTIHGFAALNKHLMEHAGIERPKFPCDVCGAQLKTNKNLKHHKAAYHNDGTTIYICSICGKVAANENALVAHKKIVHEDERKYKCTYCEKAFKRVKVLHEHIATHTGRDLYQCPHCPQTFKVSSNMHHHRKKLHPIEWEAARRGRLQIPKVNINKVTNQVVI